MRFLDPRPWHLVAPGAVVLFPDTARPVTVYDIQHTRHPSGELTVTVLIEGWPRPIDVTGTYAYPVELDESDAAAALHAAGFTVTPIERK